MRKRREDCLSYRLFARNLGLNNNTVMANRQPRPQLLRQPMRLLLFVVTVLVVLGLLLQWLNYIGGWRAHVIAIVLGIIVALVMTFLPLEYLASLNALLGL